MRPICLVATAALLALASVSPAAAQVEVRTSDKGMTYSIRVPRGYDRTAGGLIAFGFHGLGGSGEQFMQALLRAPQLRDAILVAPNALANKSWGLADAQPVEALVLELRARYRAHRALAFGFSNGAYFTLGFMPYHPKVFEAGIAHSGGLAAPINPAGEASRAFALAIIHGDADGTVPVEQSREATSRLTSAGFVHIRYDEVKGLGHSIDPNATTRAFEWIEETIGPVTPKVSAEDAIQALKDLERSARDKDFAAAAAAFDGLAGAAGAAVGRIARATKKHVEAKDESLAVAAARAAGLLGEAGLATLAKGIEDDRAAVAIASADGLGIVAGRSGILLLVKALIAAERASRADVQAAIHAALTRATGEKRSDSKGWRAYAAEKL